MARRILTPDGGICSGCGAAVERSADLCFACGQPFEGDAHGTKCPQCGNIVDEAQEACNVCGTTLPRVEEELSPDLLREMREFRAQNREDASRLERVPTAMPEETEAGLLAELESLWKLSEPFEQVVSQRRKRLQLMDRLIASARRRVRELEESAIPAEVREREELKRQLQEVLLERDEILKIEYGITEMERIYRNIITMQQKELRQKEEALRARLEGFRREIGMRDAERQVLADREATLEKREQEIESRLADLAARERELEAARDEVQDGQPGAPPEREGVSREEWLSAQKEVQEAMLKLRGKEGDVGLVSTATAVRDLRVRVSELEESIERITEERNRLEAELTRIREAEEEAREVLRLIDDLLGMLPDEEVRKFARSKAYSRYEKMMERHGL